MINALDREAFGSGTKVLDPGLFILGSGIFRDHSVLADFHGDYVKFDREHSALTLPSTFLFISSPSLHHSFSLFPQCRFCMSSIMSGPLDYTFDISQRHYWIMTQYKGRTELAMIKRYRVTIKKVCGERLDLEPRGFF